VHVRRGGNAKAEGELTRSTSFGCQDAVVLESVGCGADRRLTNDGQTAAAGVAFGFSRKASDIYSPAALKRVAFPDAGQRLTQLLVGDA